MLDCVWGDTAALLPVGVNVGVRACVVEIMGEAAFVAEMGKLVGAWV